MHLSVRQIMIIINQYVLNNDDTWFLFSSGHFNNNNPVDFFFVDSVDCKMHTHTQVINIPQQAQLALGTCFGLLFFTSLPTWATCSKTLPDAFSPSNVSARLRFASFSKCNSFVFKASLSRLIKEIRNWHNWVSFDSERKPNSHTDDTFSALLFSASITNPYILIFVFTG